MNSEEIVVHAFGHVPTQGCVPYVTGAEPNASAWLRSDAQDRLKQWLSADSVTQIQTWPS